MKLIVNIDCLTPPLTGIGHYAHNLLRALQEEPSVEDIQAIRASGWASGEELAQLLYPSESQGGGELSRARQWKAKGIAGLRSVAKRVPYARTLKRQLQNRLALAREAELAGYIYWEPNYNLLPIANPSLTTVHDLSHIHYPAFHPKERVDLLNEHLPRSIERAKHVFTVSEFTRGEVARHFGLAEEQMTVVTPAASADFRPYGQGECEEVRVRYALPEQFIISVATLEPRKNLLGLIRAFSQLPEEYRNTYPLVLVGGKGWHTGEITEALDKLPGRQLVRLGYVSQADLPKIISAATLMAYPSFYEGFGMPVLEAMAAGTPVLTSNCSSMPEVSGGASILIDPNETDSIAGGLTELLESADLRERCREAGLQNAERYAWSRSAENLIATLQGCHQGRYD